MYRISYYFKIRWITILGSNLALVPKAPRNSRFVGFWWILKQVFGPALAFDVRVVLHQSHVGFHQLCFIDIAGLGFDNHYWFDWSRREVGQQ